MGLVGSVCAHARGGVTSVVVRAPGGVCLKFAPVFVAECCFQGLRYDMLSYAASSSRDSGPPQKCSRPLYAHNTQACRYLVGPLSKHSHLLLYTFKMFYHGNDATQGFVCVGLALALH